MVHPAGYILHAVTSAFNILASKDSDEVNELAARLRMIINLSGNMNNIAPIVAGTGLSPIRKLWTRSKTR